MKLLTCKHIGWGVVCVSLLDPILLLCLQPWVITSCKEVKSQTREFHSDSSVLFHLEENWPSLKQKLLLHIKL